MQVYFTVWCVLIFHSEVHAQIEHFSERYTSIFHGEVHVLLTLRYMYCTFRSEVHVLYRSCTRMLFACALYPYVVCLVHFKFVNTADDCTYIVYYCIHTVQYCMQDGGRVELQNIDKNSVFPIITVKTGNTQCMHRCTPLVYTYNEQKKFILHFILICFYDLIRIIRIRILFFFIIIFSKNRIPGLDFYCVSCTNV